MTDAKTAQAVTIDKLLGAGSLDSGGNVLDQYRSGDSGRMPLTTSKGPWYGDVTVGYDGENVSLDLGLVPAALAVDIIEAMREWIESDEAWNR